jgi:hypothetical protein
MRWHANLFLDRGPTLTVAQQPLRAYGPRSLLTRRSSPLGRRGGRRVETTMRPCDRAYGACPGTRGATDSKDAYALVHRSVTCRFSA